MWVALDPSCQDHYSYTVFEGFEQLEEECEEATVCRLLVFRPIDSSTQLVLSSFRSELFVTFVVVIVAQKLRMLVIEDERQYHAPHLPADLVLAAMRGVDSYHALMSLETADHIIQFRKLSRSVRSDRRSELR
ncbi:hypothetical protein F511_35363 [Dorcoceras hygrometricum]|uniref:Uncharacterized protein n=1 Tax=Dorcoceras hygrometricum TaxID=472368 RepID=A0A2Z7AJW2_9LAMI|nr:hypothetical protein F511_35363 [Dorcoceras hygrometricum]